MKSLGVRCLEFMQEEMKKDVTSNPKLPATPRVKEYFSICTRLVNGKEVKLNLTQGNWCAAAVSFSMYKSLAPGEKPLHGYRVGCIEIQKDLIDSGLWHSVKDIKSTSELMLGDILITDRSNPNIPNSSWWRHILRVSKINDDKTFECISGNSTGGKYRISKHKLTDKNIIGFGFIDNRKSVGSNETIVLPTKEDDLNPVVDSFYDLIENLL